MAMDFHASSQIFPDEIKNITDGENAFGLVGSGCGRKDLLRSLSVTCLHCSQTRLRQAPSQCWLMQIESIHSDNMFSHANNIASQAGTSSAWLATGFRPGECILTCPDSSSVREVLSSQGG